jgi:ArsR family transcriptional regulator
MPIREYNHKGGQGVSDIFEMRAAVAKALAHPTRLRIIDLLHENQEACVCQLVEQVEEGQSTVSKHLAVLREAGIVDSRKDGLNVFYRLKTPCVHNFFSCLDKVILHDIQAKHALISSENNGRT